MEYNIPPFFPWYPAFFAGTYHFKWWMLPLPLAPWMFQLHAVHLAATLGDWLGVSKKTGMKRDLHYLKNHPIPKNNNLKNPSIPKIPKTKTLNVQFVDFCQPSEVLRWQVISDVLSENSTSQEYGIFPPRAAGFIIRWQLFFLTDRILALLQFIFHELYPPL